MLLTESEIRCFAVDAMTAALQGTFLELSICSLLWPPQRDLLVVTANRNRIKFPNLHS